VLRRVRLTSKALRSLDPCTGHQMRLLPAWLTRLVFSGSTQQRCSQYPISGHGNRSEDAAMVSTGRWHLVPYGWACAVKFRNTVWNLNRRLRCALGHILRLFSNCSLTSFSRCRSSRILECAAKRQSAHNVSQRRCALAAKVFVCCALHDTRWVVCPKYHVPVCEMIGFC